MSDVGAAFIFARSFAAKANEVWAGGRALEGESSRIHWPTPDRRA